MDKNAIKKYAVWARRELIQRVSQRAMLYGVTERDAGDPDAESVNGRPLSADEKRQRRALIRKVEDKGYEQTMEQAAYTWFNRFAALRFMEVNGYLPSHVRVFTNDKGEFKPQILDEAIHLELDGLDRNKVYELEDANRREGLYKYLLITQCNALYGILPGLFGRIDDYAALLLPDNLLREGSVIERMVSAIPEEDWKDQVQIIGWLYEAYNTEMNLIVYDGSFSKDKIPKELLPAATTIYTPDWPVHYMVENSLGRLWLEGHPNDALKSEWKYYLDEAEEEPEVQEQLDAIRKEYAALTPEEIRVFDPCMGSGHILCVLFDALVRIYEAYGYTAREAASKIVKYNLWGLDIDERAAQLAYFAVMMKARHYDRRFFTRKVQPHVYAIHETNALGGSYKYAMGDFLLSKEHQETLNYVMDAFIDAKEYGSIFKLEHRDYKGLKEAWELTSSQTVENVTMSLWYAAVEPEIPHLIEQAIALSQKYHVIVTNPPYLGSARFSPSLDKYVKANYPDVKSDLSMVMYKHAVDDMAMKNGFVSFITTSSWMFLSSFEKLRRHLQNTVSFSSLVDFGTELFDGKVGHNPIVAWVVSKCRINSKMTAVRLVDYCYSRRDEKKSEFFNERNRYSAKQENFSKIPGAPVAYWVNKSLYNIYDKADKLSDYATIFEGLKTRDKDRFVRFWFEIHSDVWKPYAKGGQFRRWYGNLEYVVKWGTDGSEIRAFKKSSGSNFQHFCEPTITYSALTSYKFSCRYIDKIFFGGGGGGITNTKNIFYFLAFANSAVFNYIINSISPTLNFEVGQIGSQPIIIKEKELIEKIAQDCVSLSCADWDAFETSWDFRRHPLIRPVATVAEAFDQWKNECAERFDRLKANEEELNRIFIDIYGLQEELSPEVDDKDVTVRKADLQRDIRSFVSYAVGCMFGRYSLDAPGLAYAGGPWDASQYSAFPPVRDDIIPICDDEYFDDDMTGRFVKFVETVYGTEMLEDNLRFIADALGGKGASREVIRGWFLNGFYADHLKTYQKRPIYWLFDSGKRNAFKCLIYMHRYQPDTIARIRTDYVHEQQARYRTELSDLEKRVEAASTSERVKLSKRLAALREQAEELRLYEETIHHLADRMIAIDLDDGVKRNYEIFKDALAKIK